ncbi:MAG: VOC family protein [Acidobacteriota bacterium]|nr:VOC family protein [Acidobacteriota bacterium]
MESVIAKLLQDFEQGRMNRRQLIQTIALTATAVAAGGASAGAAQGQGGHGFKAVAVNHISFEVKDYARTRDFYSDLLGMKVMADDGKRQCELVFGQSFIIPRNPFQAGAETPKVDHFAITIADWNKDQVEDELKRRGFKKKTSKGFGLGPMEYRPDTENSFHVSDPDGFDLQISGEGMKP